VFWQLRFNPLIVIKAPVPPNGLRVSRVAGVKDSCGGKERWGAAVATLAARAC